MGTLTAGKFNMIVSFQSDPDEATINQWRSSWQRASELLYSASDGAQQFGRIYFALDSFGSRNADWWVDPVNAQAHVDGNRLWQDGHGTLGFDEKDFPFIIVHEFGHYGYNCGDEYQGDGCTAEVVSCIMESEKSQGDRFVDGSFLEGEVVEWCVEANHDPNGDTPQDDYSYGGETGHSCWYAINFQWAVPTPGTTPDGTRTAGADPVEIILLEKQTRIVLILDRSGSMQGDAIREALVGADSFIDLTDHDSGSYQDHFGIVSFANAPTRELPMRSMDDNGDRTSAHTSIAGIGAGGRTAMGDALRMAIGDIEGYGDPAAAQAIVLLSDGYHNEGTEDPADMIAEIRRKGISVFSIAVGPDVDAPLLESLADETDGLFFRIPPGLSEADAALELRFALTEIHDLLHDQGGVVTRVQEELEADFPEAETERQAEFLDALADSLQPAEHATHRLPIRWGAFSRIIETEIEAGSGEATFFASYEGDPDTAELYLYSPSGDLYAVALGELPNDGRRVGFQRPYLGLRQPAAEPGQWLAVVASTSPRIFKYFTFVQHRGVALKMAANKLHYDKGERATISAHLYYREPLQNVSWEASLIDPFGQRTALEFVLPGGAGTGCDTPRYEATTPPLIREGYYQLEVTARSTETTRYAYDVNDGIESTGGADDPRPAIPQLTRTKTLTLGVGRERTGGLRPDPRTTPVRVKAGTTGMVRVRNTGDGLDGPPRVTGDPGIDIEDVSVGPYGTIEIVVTVGHDANPGPHDIAISDDAGEHVLEGAVIVTDPAYETGGAFDTGDWVAQVERCCREVARQARLIGYGTIALALIALLALFVVIVGVIW